jgi:ATP-dependent protease HslVU (ClpYQ) peptidase subunit
MGVASDSMERRNCRLKEFQHCCLVLARRIYGGGTFEAKKAKAYQMHTFRHEREQKLRSMTIASTICKKTNNQKTIEQKSCNKSDIE